MMNQIFNGEELDQEALFHPFSDNDSDISDDSMVTTIKELNENYPYINWKMYFTNRFGKYNIRYNIDDNTKILNKTPTCFKNLGTLFQKKNYDALFDVAEL